MSNKIWPKFLHLKFEVAHIFMNKQVVFNNNLYVPVKFCFCSHLRPLTDLLSITMLNISVVVVFLVKKF